MDPLVNPPTDDTPGRKRKEWTEKWIGGQVGEWRWKGKPLVQKEWTERWRLARCKQEQNMLFRPETDPGGKKWVIEDPPPTDKVIELHKGLHKAESALLVQARTKKIGLAEFLYSRKVPGVDTARCRCGAGHETPRHMALFCIEEASRRQGLTDQAGRKWSYPQLIGSWEAVRSFARWMMFSGRLGQFQLAKRLLYNSE